MKINPRSDCCLEIEIDGKTTRASQIEIREVYNGKCINCGDTLVQHEK